MLFGVVKTQPIKENMLESSKGRIPLSQRGDSMLDTAFQYKMNILRSIIIMRKALSIQVDGQGLFFYSESKSIFGIMLTPFFHI